MTEEKIVTAGEEKVSKLTEMDLDRKSVV